MNKHWLEKNNLKEVTLADYDLYFPYIKKTNYFTGLWASNFTYIWCLSRQKNITVLYKIIDGMLVTFVLTRKGFMYIWCLPFGEGDADHVVQVLLKSFDICKKCNTQYHYTKKPFVYLLNERQLDFLLASSLFSSSFKIISHESKEIIWDIPKIIERKGKEFRDIRYLLNRIRKENPTLTFRKYNPLDFDEVHQLKKRWNEASVQKYKRITDDHIFYQLFTNYQKLHEMIFVATIAEKIVGFVSGAILPNGLSWGCMAKASLEYKGIYEFLYTEFARHIKELNPDVTLLHTGSDNNHEGLRNFKEKFRPVFRLHLFSLRQR